MYEDIYRYVDRDGDKVTITHFDTNPNQVTITAFEVGCFLPLSEVPALIAALSKLLPEQPGCGCDNDPIECSHEAARGQAEAEADRLREALAASERRTDAVKDYLAGIDADCVVAIGAKGAAMVLDIVAMLTPPTKPAPFVDGRGAAHQVTVDREHHDYWTGAGELKAKCLCGWWDHYSYSQQGEGFARWKLQCRAQDHIPELAAKRG